MKTIPAKPQETAISTTHHKYSDGRWTRRGKEKLVADPKKNWDTMVAEIAEAIVGRRTAPEKLRWSSSKANIVPARGALNAAARPALAPLVMRYRSSMRVRPMRRLKPWAATAPI